MTSEKSIIKLSTIKGAGEDTVYPYCRKKNYSQKNH